MCTLPVPPNLQNPEPSDDDTDGNEDGTAGPNAPAVHTAVSVALGASSSGSADANKAAGSADPANDAGAVMGNKGDEDGRDAAATAEMASLSLDGASPADGCVASVNACLQACIVVALAFLARVGVHMPCIWAQEFGAPCALVATRLASAIHLPGHRL